jgi:replication initiation and membrane attachment protein
MFTRDSTYQLKRRGLLSRDDNEILYSLYLPLVGYKAIFIYCFLVNEYLIDNKDGKILYLLNKSDMTVSDFLLNKKSLESVGLVQTLENQDNYVFILKSALTPGDFFGNTVLKGLFVNKVGEVEATKMMKLYEIDQIDFSKYTDISAGVKDSFSINFDSNDVKLNDDVKLVTVNKNEIKDNFDDVKLIEIVTNKSRITTNDLSVDEINEIHRLGTLYGLNEAIMAKILIDGFNSNKENGKKIDLDFCNMRCKKEIYKYKSFTQKTEQSYFHSNTPIANKINYYESTSPRDFLKEKQNGVEPIKSDLDIIEYLSQNLGLSNGVINVILEYTLMKLDNKLNRNYIEKIAITCKRSGLNDAVSVYGQLFSQKKNDQASVKTVRTSASTNTEKKKDSEEDLTNLDESVSKLL